MDEFDAKLQYVRDLKKYAKGRLAEKLKAKYAPKAPEPEAPPPAEEDVDLSGLDDATIQSLIGD